MHASPLGYALLALLARGSATGYELAGRLRDPVGKFWEARHSQIYPELARLAERGMVAAVAATGPGARPKKTYTITSAGRKALRRWVGEPIRRWGGRDDLVLKVYASWVAEPSATLRLLREAESHHAAQLRGYLGDLAELRRRGADRAPPDDPLASSYAVLRRGIGHERGRLAWCRWMIRRVEGRVDGSDHPGP